MNRFKRRSGLYPKPSYVRTGLKVRDAKVGETIEQRIRRRLDANEDVEGNDGRAPLLFNENAKEVSPETDIRTDRFEIAIDAMSTNAKRADQAKRAEMSVVKDDEKGSSEEAS